MIPSRWRTALETAVAGLLASRNGDHWRGRLSSSPLSTATAVSALALAGGNSERIAKGRAWLLASQRADGGWGDTVDSPSHPATTWLARAALALSGVDGPAVDRAERFLDARLGRTPEARLDALMSLYNGDRTFPVPIAVNVALAGLIPWSAIPPLPFEMAAVPRSWYRLLRLQVVSYALPALVAVGLAIHRHHPSPYFPARWVRRACENRALGLLAQIQPENGGFLEAIPLTSFVAMSLTSVLGAVHPVAARGLDFIRAAQREDGSWAIDSDLATWLTSGAVAALAAAGRGDETVAAWAWLAARQCRRVHPYTGAAPGGWAWTDLPGGVPDADDTAGALIALLTAGPPDSATAAAVADGLAWLLGLQNSDGGWPTFCRGWGRLPFDRSAPDVTAHALRALHAAKTVRDDEATRRACAQGLAWLERTQRPDGSWLPLWFGNQAAPGQGNPVVGTARVLRALELLVPGGAARQRAGAFLVSAQGADGGWGGAKGVRATVEETALAVSALATWPTGSDEAAAAARGADWLCAGITGGNWPLPAPIGLYFELLWYAEDCYQRIWTTEALGRILQTADGSAGRGGP